MNVSEDRVLRVSRDVLFQEVNGEMVLLDMAGERYFGLNDVGARVWQLLHEGTNIGGIVETLFDEFEVDRETLEADVYALLAQLTDAGLVDG